MPGSRAWRRRVVRSSQRLRWHVSEFEWPDHTVLTTSDAWEIDIESQARTRHGKTGR